MSRKKLTGLDPSEYEHPLDKAALEKLEAILGVKSILIKQHEVWFKKIDYIDNAVSSLIVTEENLPKIHKLLLEACTILDIQKIIYKIIDEQKGKVFEDLQDNKLKKIILEDEQLKVIS